jgi:deoxyribodipyrimidine photo-lyase
VWHGDPANVVVAAALECGASTVWAQHEYSPSGIAEQEAVAAALAGHGIELILEGSPYLVAPGRVRTGAGNAYQVFTPFLRAWRQHGWRPPATAANPRLWAPLGVGPGPAIDLDQEAARGDSEDPLGAPMEFREDRWLARVKDFTARSLTAYEDDRDRPGVPGTSGLSVPLAYGQVHPRTIAAAVKARGSQAGDGASAFMAELAWRDFHADVLFHQPTALRESLKEVLPADAWDSGPEADARFVAWRAGRTGFPLVDAGMREVAATGVMHNRVRMVVASFLIKDLHLPWQRGADYFRKALLDYDHAQNQLNWQWVAGTGTDAAPYFRIFNPQAQLERFDPELAYVRRWVAELDTPEYPTPIVDHAHERERALEDYQRGRGAAP